MRRWLPILIMASLMSGCGLLQPKKEPPLEIFSDMRRQPKYKAQAESAFFSDRRASRLPVAGTVARDQLKEDDLFFTGKQADGQWVEKSPVPPSPEWLRRGQEQFNVHCSVCHDRVGTGQGIVVAKGYPPAANLQDERLRKISDGHIFGVITQGIRNMPSLSHQIPEADRWAIVSYVRALQRSQHGTLADVPPEIRSTVR